MDDFLRTLGLCRRAGRLALGDEPAGDACRAHKCRLLLLAEDAAENTARRAEHLAGTGRCPLLKVPYGKEVLGTATGRASCALLAVTDPGLANTLAGKLAGRDPDRYGEAALALSQKAERLARRRKSKPKKSGPAG